jgi:site-specific recombinase XerD
MQVGQASEAFVRYCESVRKLSAHTVRAYKLDLQRFASFAGVSSEISACDRSTLHGYVEHLFTVVRLKEASVRRHVASTRALFRWLEGERLIGEDPFARTQIRIRIPKRLPRILTQQELAAVLRPSSAPGFAAITARVAAEVLFATGIRVAELTALTDSDVDLTSAVITITGKGDRQRRVYIPDAEVRDLVATYRLVRAQRWGETDAFLVNSRGARATEEFIRRILQKLAQAANVLRRVTPHMFRHSCATYLLEAGMDIRYVQRLLGHRSISTTEIYTHVADATLKVQVTERHPRRAIVQKYSEAGNECVERRAGSGS